MSLIGRQPICDANYAIIGYDILFRDEIALPNNSDISISSSVLDRILNGFGLDNVLGGYLGFLKVDMEFLQSEIITTIPQKHFILMILESSFFHPQLENTVKILSEKGYRFGVNSCVLNSETVERIEMLHPWLEYVRIDALRHESGGDLFARLKKIDQKLIALKVETNVLFEKFIGYGADYFQGYYIKRPYTIENDSLSMSQEQILQAWNLLQDDIDIAEIVQKLEQNHLLVLQLMQFINSSYFSFSSAITSVRQVISLVGRKALSNWLLLMIESNQSDARAHHPLLLMVINRTEIMTGLLRLSSPECSREELNTAYLVGMLSLIHLVLNTDHRTFLHKLHVSDEIEDAMFEAEGKWGQLLTMTRYIENMDYDSIKSFVDCYHIDTNQMDGVIAQAMEKVNDFDSLLQNEF